MLLRLAPLNERRIGGDMMNPWSSQCTHVDATRIAGGAGDANMLPETRSGRSKYEYLDS
jgi:hypothetical protein